MPTKHINDEIWRKVELKTVEEVIRTRKSIKETEMLNRLILVGLRHFDEAYEMSYHENDKNQK